ncbi:MAG: hypothetical protein KDC93_18795 [Cyclobacteriaceae bacterium]|nr:hypothetical protein [Cyclobacteriaceae bacterium]
MNRVIIIIIALFFCLLQFGCSSDDVMQAIDCSQSTLALNLKSATNASTCTAADGVIVVEAIGGEGPYTFEIGSVKNDVGSFEGLAAGNYVVIVTDFNSCERQLDVLIEAAGSDLSLIVTLVADTDCLTGNGTITADETGGVGPFEFRLDNGSFSSASTFTALEAGNYAVEVKDNEGCSFVKIVTIAKGETGVSFDVQIKPIINTKCAITGCHNGDNGANRNWTVFSNVKANAANIKMLTGNRTMPQTGSLTQDQIDLIACWVDDGAKDN